MFEINNPLIYIVGFSLVMVANHFARKLKSSMHDKDTENDFNLIRNYLLNDSPLYGFNKPKLWIHTKYEINARKWKDFYSRNSTDLNQPFIHLTIKTIIDHCADDFHICLIDDDSFDKLIPSWDVSVRNLAEPMKSHFRELALVKILYLYGGIIVPNTFVCNKNLISFYNDNVFGNRPFICESVSKRTNMVNEPIRKTFTPDTYFMGANKNNETILELIAYLKYRNQNPHFSSESDFLGEVNQFCINYIQDGKMNLVDGKKIGIKNVKNKAITISELIEEAHLGLDKSCVGVYIPCDDFLNRTKFQWFSVLSSKEILNSNMIISKYIQASMLDDYKNSSSSSSFLFPIIKNSSSGNRNAISI